MLTVIHINDTHSHLESEKMRLVLGGESTMVEAGGYPRIVSKIKQLQKNAENVLTLNAGDMFQGSLYYSLFKGEADAALVNTILWDAVVLGNHAFDDGDAHLAGYLNQLNLDTTSILAANIEVPISNPLYNKWSPYTIKTFANGDKVGIIGIDIAGKTQYSSNPGAEVIFYDEVLTAQRYIDILKGVGVDKIILLTHVGLANDKDYAGLLDGVDVIVGGDSHSLMGDFRAVGLTSDEVAYPFVTIDRQGKRVCIVQVWEYAHIVGNLEVVFDKDGHVRSCKGTPFLVLGDTFSRTSGMNEEKYNAILASIDAQSNVEIIEEDVAAKTILKHYANQIMTQKETVIGSAGEGLDHVRLPKNGNPLSGSAVAPVVAKAFYELSHLADACIQNAGGVRTRIDAGEITINDAYTLLPFSNTLYEIQMTGAEVKMVLEDAVEEALYGGDDKVPSSGAFPYAYALRYDVDATQVYGERIRHLEVKDRVSGIWSFIETKKVYTIVTNSYIAKGKDGYLTFQRVQDDVPSKGVNTYLDYAMSFVTYVKNLTALGAQTTKILQDEYPLKSYKSVQ